MSEILLRMATTAPSASSMAARHCSTESLCSFSTASSWSSSSTFPRKTLSTSCTLTSASCTSETEAVASCSMARARPDRDSSLCRSFSRAEVDMPFNCSRTEASLLSAASSPAVQPPPAAIASSCCRVSASCCCWTSNLLFSSCPAWSSAEVWPICSAMAASRTVCSRAVASAPSSCMLLEELATEPLPLSGAVELVLPPAAGCPAPAATCSCSSSSPASQRTRQGPVLASMGSEGRRETIRGALGWTFSRHHSAKAQALQTGAPSGGTSPVSDATRAGEEAHARMRWKPRSFRPTEPRNASAACASSPRPSLGALPAAAAAEVTGRVTSRSSTSPDSPSAAFASRSLSEAKRSLAMMAAKRRPAMMRPLLVLPLKKAESRLRASERELVGEERKARCASSSQASQSALPMNSAKAECLVQRSWKPTSVATPPSCRKLAKTSG
mmetsp:Transcript_47817/g.138247  ORF Transcript_47817/g.138247 Transcript_47817/m.138247 type:complete len:443 (-) Transcript_47817:853-2181(-)